jgi:dihydrofolate reductase
MRKLILGVATSLDGFIEGPRGEYDWCLADQDYGLSEFFKRFDAIFVGRKTYEVSQSMLGGPPGFPKFKEYIFSTSLQKVKDGAVLIHSDIKAQVDKIKAEKGKDIWLFGGAGLTTSLMNMGLVDELSLTIYPVLLGGGKPLFSNLSDRVKLKLADTKTFSTGVLSLTYLIDH